MPDPEGVIKGWFDRSQGETVEFSVFDKFISLWFAFNSWGTYLSKQDRDDRMLEWVKDEKHTSLASRFLKQVSKNKRFKLNVMTLASATILDMRPGSARQKRHFSPSEKYDDFRDILNRIYRVRCNLFHGQKSMGDANDKMLVKVSFEILSEWFRLIIEVL